MADSQHHGHLTNQGRGDQGGARTGGGKPGQRRGGAGGGRPGAGPKVHHGSGFAVGGRGPGGGGGQNRSQNGPKNRSKGRFGKPGAKKTGSSD